LQDRRDRSSYLAHLVQQRQPIVHLARLTLVINARKEPAVTSSSPRLRTALALAAFGLTSVAIAGTAAPASADVRIRIGGGGHVRFGGWHRPRIRYHGPTIRIGGAIWLGGGSYYYAGYDRSYAQPPPPPPPPRADACACGPAYYPPVAPPPGAYAVAAAPAPVRPPLPRLGLGAYIGGVAVEGKNEGQDVGLVGQFRLGRGLLIEGELAKNELADGDRVDRRLMAGLTYELAPYRPLTPYITGGLGVTQVDVGGGELEDSQSLAEIGGGLRWRMSERISVFGDLRLGARQQIEHGDELTPQPADPSLARVMPDNDEQYSRLRLGAMLTF
jgi:opacity protein-like surface antigen